MDDLLLRRALERRGDADRDVDRLALADLLVALEARLERLAGHELHDEELRPAGRAELEALDDVRVVKPHRRLGLAAKARDVLLVAGEMRRQDLDRYGAPRRDLLRLVDGA